MPPQTQGSEDILVPGPGELELEDDAGYVDGEVEGGEGFLEEVVDSEDELAL